MHDYLRDVASGASKAAPNQQKSRKELVARLKKAYLLPGTGGGEAAGVITELDLALIEGVARTLSRARTKVEELPGVVKSQTGREKYAAMGPEGVAAKAVSMVGGFLGFGDEVDAQMLDGIRGLMIDLTKKDAF